MRRHQRITIAAIVLLLTAGLFLVRGAGARSSSMEATKRDIYQDKTTESMRDVYIRREKESKQYRDELLSNSEETVRLLREIRNLLQDLVNKEPVQIIDSYGRD